MNAAEIRAEALSEAATICRDRAATEYADQPTDTTAEARRKRRQRGVAYELAKHIEAAAQPKAGA